MRGEALKFQTAMVTEVCCSCAIEFAVPVTFRHHLERTHQWFYCPNGHPQHYTGTTEAEALRKELEAERARKQAALERANLAELDARNARSDQQRAGVCPCCNRTFQNLARHMATKHP